MSLSPVRLPLAEGHVIDFENVHLKLANDVSMGSFGSEMEALLVY